MRWYTMWGWVQPTIGTVALMVPPRVTQYIPCVKDVACDAAEDMVVKRRCEKNLSKALLVEASIQLKWI